MVRVPLLRAGRPYQSLATLTLSHVATGEPVAEVSQANAGLIAHDLLDAPRRRRVAARRGVDELIDLCRRAGQLFAEASLPIDPELGQEQSADEYVALLSSTTGLPRSLCRTNMAKIRFVLENMEKILAGLTRGLDLSVLDRGHGVEAARTVSWRPEADSLAAVLPGNSPGVHALWLPAIPLKAPLFLKPGSLEPWSPLRIAQALIAAGVAPEAIGYYPTDHAGSELLMTRAERVMAFGDQTTVERWRGDPRVEIHGPGWSKIVIGPDVVDQFDDWLDVVVKSVASNGGRSCVNASSLWVPSRGREIADALARRLAAIGAYGLEDPRAELAAFPDPRAARRISAAIDSGLRAGNGAEEITSRHREGDRVIQVDGCTFLLPTVVFCDDATHPLAEAEYLFPFVSVVEVDRDYLLDAMGPALVVTAITDDAELKRSLLQSRKIDRLNFGRVPTSQVFWDQPHEGNLFEFLYRRRSFAQLEASPSVTGAAE